MNINDKLENDHLADDDGEDDDLPPFKKQKIDLSIQFKAFSMCIIYVFTYNIMFNSFLYPNSMSNMFRFTKISNRIFSV